MRIILGAAIAILLGASAPAQVTTIDPNRAIDGDLATSAPRQASNPSPAQRDESVDAGNQGTTSYAPAPAPPTARTAPAADTSEAAQDARADATLQAADTYQRDDLLAAGEGVFGKGAAGMAGLLEKILKEQGRPNAYIAGREAAGAFVVGLRYGSGVMTHKIEGQRPVYWTGPSVGFDFGGDANKVFTLVYNLYDTEDLYHRFPAAEGRLYFVGGFAATYLRRGNIVLIPIRLGVGYRAGVNVGYMKFSHTAKWLPF
ncbi:MAG: DUF1134 domain-containing protein [Pseudomonadota bacterium]|nr:DUF1134 domain-containing protein [Pseudomonadota bacterium]